MSTLGGPLIFHRRSVSRHWYYSFGITLHAAVRLRSITIAHCLARFALQLLASRDACCTHCLASTSLTLKQCNRLHRLSLLLTSAAALVPHRTTQRLQPLSNDVIDVTTSAVVGRLENSPYPSLVEKVELFLEKPLGGENQYLVKGSYEAPGAAVLYCFG